MRIVLATLILATGTIQGADRFIGWQSCGTSGCHGGGTGKDQVQIWQKKDPHSRAYGILIAERSKRMAETLRIADASKDAQCTVCHSPMHSAAKERLAPTLKNPNLGVSCESCHGPAENYLRFHTRPDISHAQRLAAGLRDLDSHYNRANSCVGCHGNLPMELLNAGHPPLRFEMARQTHELPPHWHDYSTSDAPAQWMTGQAALLRELSWLGEKGQPQPQRIAALQWILRETTLGADLLPKDSGSSLRTAADSLAKAASKSRWSPGRTREQLNRFSALAPGLTSLKSDEAFARADVLTGALRAMVLGLGTDAANKAKATLSSLDLAVRSPAIFDAGRFAGAVAELTSALPPAP